MVTVTDLTTAAATAHQYGTVITAGPTHSETRFNHPHHIVRSFYDKSEGRGAPTLQQVADILAYPTDGDVLIHCHRGESRSTAIAIGWHMHHGASPLDACHLTIASMTADTFTPNTLILHHIATILDTPGLVATIAAHWPAGQTLPLEPTRTW